MSLRRTRITSGSWLKPMEQEGRMFSHRQLPVDVEVEPNQIVVRAHLPGFTPDEIDVWATTHGLTISTNRPAESTPLQRVTHEVYVGNWYRRMRLVRPVRPDQAAVTYENGVLTICLPRVPSGEDLLKRLPGSQTLERKEIPLRSSADVSDLGPGPTFSVFKS
ncbi:MAG TPA: Hsp20/alpha crystallin family protein [Chloroflexota bacterium]|nr:Hsp20/alpha crystallin family protein [Chloroflexota bacterium]